MTEPTVDGINSEALAQFHDFALTVVTVPTIFHELVPLPSRRKRLLYADALTPAAARRRWRRIREDDRIRANSFRRRAALCRFESSLTTSGDLFLAEWQRRMFYGDPEPDLVGVRAAATYANMCSHVGQGELDPVVERGDRAR